MENRNSAVPAVLISLWFASMGATFAQIDTVWREISDEDTTYEVHVVTDAALGSGFPARDLRIPADQGLVTDIYVVDTATGDAVSVPRARSLVSLVQSSYKRVALPTVNLSASEALPAADLDPIGGGPSGLLTSHYFSTFFVNNFIKTGFAGGLDSHSHRRELYRQLLFDLWFQPDMVDVAADDAFLQHVLDGSSEVTEYAEAMGNSIEAVELASDTIPIALDVYKNGVAALSTHVENYFDLSRSVGNGPPAPLERMSAAIDGVTIVASITGNAARTLLLQSLAHERAERRMRLWDGLITRAATSGPLDSALQQGFTQAEQDLQLYLSEYYNSLDNLLTKAILDSSEAIISSSSLAKYAVHALFGKAAAATFAKVTLPYYLSYKVYGGIRDQEDRARTASLAATLQRLAFESFGLPHYRSQMLAASSLDGVDAQSFFELYQMSWYLAARHYLDTLESLNNRLSRVYGAGLDIISGGAYSLTIEDIKKRLGRARVVAQRITPTAYLAGAQTFDDLQPQPPELSWLLGRVRGEIVTTPEPIAPPMLGICVTFPFAPAGFPADGEKVNIRFEPWHCADPAGAESWECGPNDPDGECHARLSLAWDNDTNSSNADCDNGQGPCPILGAESVSIERGSLVWQPARDGLEPGTYYVRAELSQGGFTASDYSPGPIHLQPPILEADHWTLVGAVVAEGGRSNGDGIPELGEEIGITLYLDNLTPRSLEGVKITKLRLAKDSVRYQTDESWDESDPDDRELTYIFDGTTLAPDAPAGAVVAASDELDVWIGTRSPTTVPFVARVEYWDPTNPVDPDLRRLQEIGFSVELPDGPVEVGLRCDHIDVTGTNDGDSAIESGESGSFTATLCNDGDWAAIEPFGTMDEPPEFGRWTDATSPYQNIDPGECKESEDDYRLRTEPHECGTLWASMTVRYGDAGEATVTCPVSVECVPYQSVVDDKHVGTYSAGELISTSVGISNPGASPLTLSGVSEQSGATDTSFALPGPLAAAASDSIGVTIDTAELAPGLYDRTLVIQSDAYNTDESVSVVSFGIVEPPTAVQLTSNAISLDVIDVDGDWAVFRRGLDIYAINVLTSSETRITDTPDREWNPRISGDYVVFHRDNGDPASANVFLYQISTGIETRLTDLTGQRNPDISGTTVVWEDRRQGTTESDIYFYEIGSSQVNGDPLIQLPSRRAAIKPRIEDGYVAYRIQHYHDPGDDSTYRNDVGYAQVGSSPVALDLEDNSPCDPGYRLDTDAGWLVFECNCGSSCDNDDQIYAVDMSTGSSPSRMTCNAALSDDREEPAILGSEVLYIVDGTNDLYTMPLGAGCQNEVPLSTGPSQSRYPAADPESGRYVFLRNVDNTGYRIWGRIPPPPVDVAVSSISVNASTVTQGLPYDVTFEILNEGTDAIDPVALSLMADESAGSVTVCTPVSGALSPGQSEALECAWTVGADTLGPVTLTASLAPPLAGDADTDNDSRSTLVTAQDDDTVGPTISQIDVLAGPGDDGDAYIEDDEVITAEATVVDGATVQTVEFEVEGVLYPAANVGSDRFAATIPNPGVGVYDLIVHALDDDDTPESTQSSSTFEVLPANPTVVSTAPIDGATGIDPRADIVAEFSVDMDPASFTHQTVLVETAVGQVIEGVLVYDGTTRSLTFTPASSLPAQTMIDVTIVSGSSGVRDVRGNVLWVDAAWSFTTDAPDAGSLRRGGRRPASGLQRRTRERLP